MPSPSGTLVVYWEENVPLLINIIWEHVLFTCVILAFLIGCWADRVDWLAEDHRWFVTLARSSALGWPWSRPSDSSQAQTQTSAGAQETAAPSGLSRRLGLQPVLSSTLFETGRSSHLEIKVMKLTYTIPSGNWARVIIQSHAVVSLNQMLFSYFQGKSNSSVLYFPYNLSRVQGSQ